MYLSLFGNRDGSLSNDRRRGLIMVSNKGIEVKSMVYMALMVALICVCAWISIPAPPPLVPFTLQTFAIFVVSGLFGWKKSGIILCVYVLLGMVGLPVFTQFKGGVGAIVGPTGGYIVGFVLQAVVTGLMIEKLGNKTITMAIAMIVGLAVCYAFGTAWFVVVYTSTKGAMTVGAALLMCVVPYLIPDFVKMVVAITVVKAVSKQLKL